MPGNADTTITNRVMLNLPHHPGLEPPEPGVAPIVISDRGKPESIAIHGVRYVRIEAGVDQLTMITIQFEGEVGGVIGGNPVDTILQEQRENKI